MRRAAAAVIAAVLLAGCGGQGTAVTAATSTASTVAASTTVTASTTTGATTTLAASTSTTTSTTTTTVPASALDGIVLFVGDGCAECAALEATLGGLAGEVPLAVRPAEEGMLRLPVVLVQFGGQVAGRWEGQTAVNSAEAIARLAADRWPEWEAFLETGTTTTLPPPPGCPVGDGEYMEPGYAGDFDAFNFVDAHAETICVQLSEIGLWTDPTHPEVVLSLLKFVVRRTEQWGDDTASFLFTRPGGDYIWPAVFTDAETHPDLVEGPSPHVTPANTAWDTQLGWYLREGNYYFLELGTAGWPVDECPDAFLYCDLSYHAQEGNARLLAALRDGTPIDWDDISTYAFFVYLRVAPPG